MIVLGDADIDHAVAGALWAGFANTGQSCAGIERVYVMRGVSERFSAALVAEAQRLRSGDPLGWGTEIGPLTSRARCERVREMVDEAIEGGAQLRCGGPVEAPDGLSGCFFAPAVLTGVTQEMRIMREEILGPVLPVVTVDSEDEAVALANASAFGLGASVWTGDRCRGELFARELEAGMVWINDHMFSRAACQSPWGGTKESGLGRTQGRFGLYECVNIKLRTWESSRVRDPWWHPYDARQGAASGHDRPLRPAVDSRERAAPGSRAVDEARCAPRQGRRQEVVRRRTCAPAPAGTCSGRGVGTCAAPD